jgi:hypothetical protein
MCGMPATITALQQIKGVLSVQPVVSDLTLAMAHARAKHEITMKLYGVLADG